MRCFRWQILKIDEFPPYVGALGPMSLYGPIATHWNGGADQLKFPEDQLKLHGCVHFTKETCVCGFKMSKKWSFRPIRNDARPIVAAGRPRMVSTCDLMLWNSHHYHCKIFPTSVSQINLFDWSITSSLNPNVNRSC